MIAAVLVGCAIVACTPAVGGPSPTSTTTTVFSGPTTTTTPVRDATEAFRSCLEDRDVSIAEIPLDGLGRPRISLVTARLDYTDPDVSLAVTECSVTLSGGALAFVVDDLIERVVVDQLHSFSACVRARGVAAFPDPIDGFSGRGSPYPVAVIPYGDPRLPGAVAACRDLTMDELPGVP